MHNEISSLKRIWVTGGRGFIGSHLIRFLRTQEYLVSTIGHGAYTSDEAAQIGLNSWIDGSVNKSNFDQLASVSGAPDLIVHLAGGSSVGKSITQPNEDFERTVISTLQALDWIRLSRRSIGFVFVSSAAVYGTSHSSNISEDDPSVPFSPYGSHKLIAEELCRSFGRNYGISSCVIRPFSVFGPNLRKQLIFDLCGRLSKEESVLTLDGTGAEQRDWIHISDLVRLIRMSFDWASCAAEAFNAGNGIGVTTRELSEAVHEAWCGFSNVKFTNIIRPGDPHYLVANPQKIFSRGFRSDVNWRDGISDVVLHYREQQFRCSKITKER